MPIPANIDPIRVLTLCFGIELPATSDDTRDTAMGALCDFLGISPEQRVQLGNKIKPSLEAFMALSSQKGEGWLELAERMKIMMEAFITAFNAVFEALTPDVHTKIDQFLATPRIPPDILATLIPVIVARMARPEDNPANEPRAFCSTILTGHPAAFHRARIAFEARSTDPFIAANDEINTDQLQPLGRVMDYLERTRNFRTRPRGAIEGALDAWHDAFEDGIFRSCLFVWYVAQPSAKTQDQLVPPQGAAGRSRGKANMEAKKGPVFKEARAWCEANAIAFPFYPNLDKLRNSHAHGDYRSSARLVDLRDHNGIFDTMTVEDLVARVTHDVHFALHFQQGLTEAETDHMENSPEIDAAWLAAVQCLPALAKALKPNRTRRQRPPTKAANQPTSTKRVRKPAAD